jgi:hypothetical protein
VTDDTSIRASNPASLDVGLLRDYAALKLKRDALDAELGKVKRLLVKYEEPVRNAMIDSGIKRCPVEVAGETLRIEIPIPTQDVLIHLWTQIRGRRKDGYAASQVASALKASGLGEFVEGTYNWQRLDEYVRECIKAEREHEEGVSIVEAADVLPEELRKVLHVYEHTEARCKKG